jgi:valyl-tRNA synthetase
MSTTESAGPDRPRRVPDKPRSVPDRPRSVPDRPGIDGLEDIWNERWEADGTYRFDRDHERDEIFAIDTPPPTVSGSLHIGHVFSYTHTDTVARYRRMRGLEVFYPMGWDDNGVPTERRVENHYGVRCDPALPYDEDFIAPDPSTVKDTKRRDDLVSISRRNFIELCEQLVEVDEQAFEHLWRHLGLSVDWSHTYTTIGDPAQRASQRAFLRNLARGEAYQAEAPTLWDIRFGMAVSQAELEDRERPGAYHEIAFGRDGADPIVIDTTRPELIPACVALVAHPDDERYQQLFGTEVTTPVFGVSVPVLAHELAEPDKGTGIAMICTFGDTTDVTWWRELDLPVRAVVDHHGRMRPEAPPGLESDTAQAAYAELAGQTMHQSRTRIVEMLTESGDLLGEPRDITHAVKFYEKGDRPLEIVTSRQWYIRNGGRSTELQDALISRGAEIDWHPSYMQTRFDDWVRGLNGDWLISRQRYFGVPIPVWYGVDEAGEVDHDNVIVPDEADLPVDPASAPPPGHDESQRGEPGGFVGETDIFDTWATSSLTPQIACGWEDDPDLFARTFPMDLRPQAHDIIRTWLFSTVVRAHFEQGLAPWHHAALSGWILDPDRKKMSKSKGNVVTPMAMLERFGSDAVRYWAASGRPGTDTAFDEGQMKVGRRLAIKILNVSRFVLNLSEEGGGAVPTAIDAPLDRAMLARLSDLVDDATTAFDDYDYARALERTETFFWSFCDNHVELVKGRAYGSRGDGPSASARAALDLALSTMLRLFAPVLPFATEEVWSWWQEGSIHRASWPASAELREHAGDADPLISAVAADVLGRIRKAKTESGASLRADVDRVVVYDTGARLAALALTADDVRDAGRVTELETVEIVDGESARVEVSLADPDDDRTA